MTSFSLPVGSCLANNQAVSTNSSMSSTSITPSCLSTTLLICAEPVMDHYGTTGMCRASFALYNTLAEADALAAGVERAVKMLRN